ncbi:hypothetical protein CI105_00255 [Candidatus Izimaplasma bacterium ZiA1]|uniref:hypothetical protein n=1 Tax=Candidatus Izimoplasma sp. ZiA1 TaxID=2024899 RepID=UPI000BAA8D19|nr:hypothetical protein CI105_00255 [Candidatus Izimaplasma bacterium ZiA1]
MPFDISFGGFINFFFGMISGVILFTVIYVQLLIRGNHLNLEDIKRSKTEIDEEELKNMIIAKQNQFKQQRKLPDSKVGKLTFELSYELLEDISRYFFPDSKYPMLELSVNEFLTLNHYITDRVDELLEKPILKNTKKMRITKVVEMFDKKKQIEDSKIMKTAKKLKIQKALQVVGAAVNIVNPVYWFRKLVINTSVDMLTRKVCIVIIGIVGEETTKIYSKNVFDAPIELDIVEKEMEKLLEGEEEEKE